MSEMLGDKIRDFLDSSELVQKAKDPKTHDMIREGFADSFGKVKDRLGDSWEDVQTIYRMAFDDTFDMKKETKYAVLGALAYLVSPVDLLPEKRMGALGYVDDVAVLMFALKYAGPEIERYRAFKGEADAVTPTDHQLPGNGPA
jgi:uncharacterized membrane protein YkvA (DUF1232 family)